MQQLEFDLRLDYERNLKDNLITVAKFAQEQMKQDLSDNGRPLKTVESEQEAYGIAAQQYVKVGAKATTAFPYESVTIKIRLSFMARSLVKLCVKDFPNTLS